MTTELIVIAGVSGAGATEATKTFEEAGWFVMDNLPPQAFENVVALCAGAGVARAAVVVRPSGRELFEGLDDGLSGALKTLASSGHKVRTLFLDASDDTLVRRFDEKRRRHPFDRGEGVVAAIRSERDALASLKAIADLVIETTALTPHELRTRLLGLYRDANSTAAAEVSLVSFGFKHGIPTDADFVFDARFLPNPHWVDELRPLTGADQKVVDYVMSTPQADRFVELSVEIVDFSVKAMAEERRQYTTVAIGCTGGRHRSVVLAQQASDRLNSRGLTTSLRHRDLDR